jgi:hypothetical protein
MKQGGDPFLSKKHIRLSSNGLELGKLAAVRNLDVGEAMHAERFFLC